MNKVETIRFHNPQRGPDGRFYSMALKYVFKQKATLIRFIAKKYRLHPVYINENDMLLEIA